MKNTTEEKREAIPNSVSRMLLAGIGVLLQVLWIFWLALKLNDYSTAIQVCTSVLTFLITLRIYGLHINSAYKISWIILILLFPIFGLTIYLLFGRSGAVSVMRRRFGVNMTMLRQYHAPILQQRRALPYPDRITRNHARYLQDRAGYPAYDNTDVTFYGDTCEALEAQKTALRSAEKFIFMEYHAIEDASAWQELEDILAERAAHGVEVRVFYDDVGSIGFINSKFVKKLAGRGIQCRRFNPVIPILNVFMNNRDHRKITVVDGRVGFTGGYNLAEEYFNRTHPYGQWKDSGIRLEGDAVRGLTLIFLELWGATQKAAPEVERYLPDVPYTARENAVVLPSADNPLDDEATGENVYLNMIRKRAGVPDIEEVYPDAAGDQTRMRELIRHERQVELCFENLRYFDTRTWMTAETDNNMPVYGMNISAKDHKANGEFWQRVICKYDGGRDGNRVFTKRCYLFPISQEELDRVKCTQNYGW